MRRTTCIGVKGCHRQVVDLVGQHLFGRDAQYSLHLCQDHSEVGNRDDVRAGMGGTNTTHDRRDTRRRNVPAFTARRRMLTRFLPIGARQIRVPA